MNYLTTPPDQSSFYSFPYPFSSTQNNTTYHQYYSTITPADQIPSPVSNSDDSDETLLHHHTAEMAVVTDERRQRRMISNRESARRSRMRKQRHLDELWSQVVRLTTQNNTLMEKLSSVSESHDRAVKENKRLKEEADDLRHVITTMRLATPPYDVVLGDLEEIPCSPPSDQPSSTHSSLLS